MTKVRDIVIDVVRRDPADILERGAASEYSRPTDYGVLRVLTDDGLEGNAIIGEFWGTPEAYFDPILSIIKPEMVGRDASDREWLWDRHNELFRRFRLSDPPWAAVDIALWDIAGKAADLPVYRLLGAQRSECPAYATYPWLCERAEDYLAEVEDALSRGFRAYKSHPGPAPTAEVCRGAEMLRDRVGDDMALMLDPNGDYDYDKALTVGRALDANGFHWFEDPVAYYDIELITELSRRLDTPLCLTDQAPQQFFQSARYVRAQACRMVRGTALRLGITGLKKLCSMAEAFGLNCEIGTGGNPINNAANLHVMQSVANTDFHENLLPGGIERFGLTDYIDPDENGMVRVPEKPGIGLPLDEDWIKASRVETLR